MRGAVGQLARGMFQRSPILIMCSAALETYGPELDSTLGPTLGPELGAALDKAFGLGVVDGLTFGEALGDKLGPTLREWLGAAL
jgi:hypothetical protein